MCTPDHAPPESVALSFSFCVFVSIFGNNQKIQCWPESILQLTFLLTVFCLQYSRTHKTESLTDVQEVSRGGFGTAIALKAPL